MRRHDLVHVSEECWHTARDRLGAVGTEPLVVGWVSRGWPFVARRRAPGEDEAGVPLALPLPPSAGKRRLAFLVAQDCVVSVEPPPLVTEVSNWAPRSWRPTLGRLSRSPTLLGPEVRVCGSLAWATLTGLNYLGPASDLDVLVPLRDPASIDVVIAELAAVEAEAPMRIDAELVRHDGLTANWRDVQAARPEIFAESLSEATVIPRDAFLQGAHHSAGDPEAT